MLHPVQNENVSVPSAMKSLKTSTHEHYVKHGGNSLSRPVYDCADCTVVEAALASRHACFMGFGQGSLVSSFSVMSDFVAVLL